MSGVIAVTTSPSAPSSRHWGTDVFWATVLNLSQAGGPFLAIMILARLHGMTAAGEFAYAQALTAPVAQLLNLQLKALILTHSSSELPLSVAFKLRGAATSVGLLIAGGFAVFVSPSASVWMLVRLVDSWAELFQSEAQREGRMARAAVSAFLRAVALVLCIAGSNSLVAAAFGYLLVSVLLLLTVDRCETSRETVAQSEIWTTVLRSGAMLGFVLFLQSASSSIPRVVLEQQTDLATLGILATLSTLVQTGNLVASAYGQGLLPSLSSASRRRIAWWVILPALAGLVACAIELTFPSEVLGLLGIQESAAARQLLTAVGVSQILIWPSAVIGYCLTSRRLYGHLVWVGVALLGSSALASIWLVPLWGAVGAVAALAVPAVVNLLLGFSLLPRGKVA
jgi:O-antigen/teichoic acid export membrane protein